VFKWVLERKSVRNIRGFKLLKSKTTPFFMNSIKKFNIKRQRPAMTAAFAVWMVALIQVQMAQAASTDNLADLVSSGGTLTIADKTFSGFSFLDTGLSGFDASSILVTASVDPSDSSVDFLTFTGNMQLAGTSFATADLLLGYTVTASAGSISMIDQRYTGGVVNGGLLINETATSAGAPTAHSQLSIGDVSDPNTYPSGPFDTGEQDLLFVNPPQTTLNVTKDLAFVILAADPGNIDIASVSLVQQSFHQVVPEPASAGCFLLGLGVLVFTRRLKLSSHN
jgi:hypothetical protein